MGARLKAAQAHGAEMRRQNFELMQTVGNYATALREAQDRAVKAEAKLAAIDEAKRPEKPRDPFEDRAQFSVNLTASRGVIHVGVIVNRHTGGRIEVEGTHREDVLAELKRRDEAETAAWRARFESRPVKPVNDPETGELLGHLIYAGRRWRILDENDLGHAAALESYKAKLRVKVEIKPDSSAYSDILAQVDRATQAVAKAHEERLEDSLMALGWTPPVFSTAAARRANLLKLSRQEATRRPQLWQDALGMSYWGVAPPSDRAVVKVTY